MAVTKNTNEEIIAVVQAKIDGKRIRATCIGHDAFVEVHTSNWDFSRFRYEVMTEPKAVYLVSKGDATSEFCYYKQESAELAAEYSGGRVVKFVEVVE